MADAIANPGRTFSRRFELAGFALGFGLGGFFDGILLHQILQWHHLLSGIEEARQDIRVLILTDGLFHILMYAITGVGLWLLVCTRGEFAGVGADRRLLANAIFGFGIWHILDAVLSHWILGIHRIRMDVDNPLLWDLLWFAVFGLAPLAIGWIMRRGDPAPRRWMGGSPLCLVLAVMVAGPLAALPAPKETTVMVLFRPGTTPAEAYAAVQAVDGRMVWVDQSEQLWAIDLSNGGRGSDLYRHGALLVGNSIIPAGCLSWIRT
ncbi:DUF2243 domain-containing protein [Rhizobium sp. LCM 4573]|uniref:DUF2243 domain-containing protein n=1 Tax=Rhizobium sp. LCM 4573 TaxID=1848291 RepID=UPI0008DAA80C|nr:DUF2243 domain-containing protein [Rhizobium sp. LCM 4573]OHV78831.1 hypothetical protein LCM4573_26105 [Rhizobium sp. LCM 4573]